MVKFSVHGCRKRCDHNGLGRCRLRVWGYRHLELDRCRPLVASLFRFCPAYLPFGLSTCAAKTGTTSHCAAGLEEKLDATHLVRQVRYRTDKPHCERDD